MKKKIFYSLITFGLTALIGVGAFVGLHNKSIKETMAIGLQKKQKKLTEDNIEDIIGSNNIYYAVAKNYSSNGEGEFYQNSISLDNSAIMGRNPLDLSLTADIISNNTLTSSYFNISVALNSGVYKLSSVALSVNTNYYYIYKADIGLFNRQYCAFVFTNANYRYSTINQELYNFISLFDIYLLDGGTFTFNQQINYYAPYGQDIDTYFVNDSTMTSASSSTTKTILENSPFYSGGLVFDTIRLRYFSAQGLSYYDNSGNRQTWSADNFASYSWIEYVNSATNRVIVVNQRLTQAWNSGSNSGVVQTKGSRWLSTEYQNISFFIEPSQTTITTLSTLNNSSYQSNTYINGNTDVGIGGAFSLLSQAFSAWLPVFSVSIIPGITLGMLIFLPLIAGIIVLIIWIVKR